MLPDNSELRVTTRERVLSVSSLRLLRHLASRFPILPQQVITNADVEEYEDEDNAGIEDDEDYDDDL